jgi:2-oxoglutarate dehydrogenase E2 component (dihydrolipoamide succinyltransferase)
MPFNIVVPELGESVVEATVGKWLKKEGERVRIGEPVVELETDKVNLEVSAEKEGVLGRIQRQKGEDVKIGDVLGTIEESSVEGVPATPGAPAQESRATTTVPVQTAQPEPAKVEPAKVTEAPKPASESAAEPLAEKVTPVARRMAEELGVDISKVEPSGNRVTKGDIERFLNQQPTTASTQAPQVVQTQPAQSRAVSAPSSPPIIEIRQAEREERVKMSRRRRTIAQRLVEAQHNAAMLTTFNEIDMSAVMAIREQRKVTFKEKHGVNLGFMSFFVKAAIGALKMFPMINAELDGDEVIVKKYYDIGIAVGAAEGLVVPVLRDADHMSFSDIEKEIKRFANEVEKNTLSLEDLRGGTFTITNGGVFGSMMSTPILNAPQVGILGLHKIEKRPVVINDEIAIRPMMYVALSYDHRIVDGRESVQFLVRVKELIEDPHALLLEG